MTSFCTFKFRDGEVTISERQARVFIRHSEYLSCFDKYRKSRVPAGVYRVPGFTREMADAISYLSCAYSPCHFFFDLHSFLHQCAILDVWDQYIVFILQRIPVGKSRPLVFSERNNLAKAIYYSSHFSEWSNLTDFLLAHIGASSADFCPTWDWDQFISFYTEFGTSRCRFLKMYGWLPESTRSMYCKCRTCSPEEFFF